MPPQIRHGLPLRVRHFHPVEERDACRQVVSVQLSPDVAPAVQRQNVQWQLAHGQRVEQRIGTEVPHVERHSALPLPVRQFLQPLAPIIIRIAQVEVAARCAAPERVRVTQAMRPHAHRCRRRRNNSESQRGDRQLSTPATGKLVTQLNS